MWKIIAAALVVLLIAAFLVFRSGNDADTSPDGSLSSPTVSERQEHHYAPPATPASPALSSPAVTAPTHVEAPTEPPPRKITKSTTGTIVVPPGGVQKTTP